MFNIFPQDFVITFMVFYWAYLILVGIYLVMGFFCVYHLVRFGFFSFVNISVILIFIGVSVWLIWYSLNILAGFDWNMSLFDPNWINGVGDILNFFSTNNNLPTVKF